MRLITLALVVTAFATVSLVALASADFRRPPRRTPPAVLPTRGTAGGDPPTLRPCVCGRPSAATFCDECETRLHLAVCTPENLCERVNPLHMALHGVCFVVTRPRSDA